ncbi:MAG: single-stranded-DNA-specific exonuclease RecJ, partial [Candidatus Margulisiibacteriota bacterium]
MNNRKKQWEILPQNPNLADTLANALKLSPLTAQVLIHRGITNCDQAQIFLMPKLSALRDPLDFPQIKEAAQRIFSAREKNEKVCVFGDYDVDGVTGTAL